jgi:hypothetical protein
LFHVETYFNAEAQRGRDAESRKSLTQIFKEVLDKPEIEILTQRRRERITGH